MSPPRPLLGLDPAAYRPHALHAGSRHWPQTNCYADLWIELVASLRLAPEAMLGFTVLQDFEGDQFGFFKVPLDDLAALYGIRVGELALFDRLEAHVVEQLGRGRLVIVEVDGFHLPDTRGVSYRRAHTKTTIGIEAIDPASRCLIYFHNDGLFSLSGEDYDCLFGRPGETRRPAELFPYAEFAKFGTPNPDLAGEARRLLVRHLAQRPRENPIRAYRVALAHHLDDLASRPPDYFHAYAFNTLRQLGANFELLGSHLAWLDAEIGIGLEGPGFAANAIAEGAKLMQFKLARAVARRRFEGLDASLDPMAEAWDELMAALDTAVLGTGHRPAAILRAA